MRRSAWPIGVNGLGEKDGNLQGEAGHLGLGSSRGTQPLSTDLGVCSKEEVCLKQQELIQLPRGKVSSEKARILRNVSCPGEDTGKGKHTDH